MRTTSHLAWAVFAGLLLAGGCAKLSHEQTFDLDPGEVRQFNVDPIKRDQKLQVAVTASGPVDVLVCLEKDEDEARRSFLSGKADKVLANSRDKAEAKLEAAVPANSGAVVVFFGVKDKANVKMKITN